MKQEFDSAETNRLLEALYGDASDTGSATAAISELSESEALDLESLRSVRAMFADMVDVEPPAEISEGLLVAAAKSVAPASVAHEVPGRLGHSSEGLWAKILNWFQPLIAHPGLAAAASLALVASIGGVLYMNNRGNLAEPQVVDEAAERAATAAEVKSPAADLPSDSMSGALDQDTDDEESPKQAETFKEAPKPEPTIPEATRRNESRKSGGSRVRSAAKIGTKDSLSLEKDSVVGGTVLPGSKGSSVTDGSSDKTADSVPLQGQALEFETAENADEAPPAPPATQSPNGTSTIEAKKSTELEKLKRQGSAAAESGDCAQARSIGVKVQKLDRRYFTGVFKTDSDIRSCYSAKKKK